MKKLLVVLLAMLCVLTLAGCSNGGSGNGGSDEPAGDGTVTVKLGGSGPLSGDAKVYGEAVRNAAQLAGININKMHTILCINCSTIAALGGAILAGRMHSATAGSVLGTEFEGIIASCLGGISFGGGSGTMGGAFIGLMLMGFFNNGLTGAGLSSYWQIVASGCLLIAALIVDLINENIRVKNLKKRSEN